MKIDAPWVLTEDALRICALLTDAGHQAWFVGGCVRNAIIGADPTDIDITTDAHPERAIALAEAAGLRVIPTGIAHGTVTVLSGGQSFEVTTFRRDVETFGRHATVAFAQSIEEDAQRRDFTMNALYAAPDGTVSDPLGGLPDLLAGHVRFIGDPHDRIKEDYLRILRFFRFHAWYGAPDGGIDADGLAACAELFDSIGQLSHERIGAEMRKLLSAPDPAPALAAMSASGVLMHLLRGAAANLIAVLVHVEQAAGLPPEWLRRLAALGGEGAEDTFRLSRNETTRLKRLRDAVDSEMGAGELGYRLGRDDAVDVLAIRSAISSREIDTNQAQLVSKGATSTCPVKSTDLMPRFKGPELGVALKAIENRWIASGFTLTRDELLPE